MSTFMRIALALVIIGAINWGLIGFFQYDLVASIFGGQDALLSRIVYALVGLSGLASLGILFQNTEEVIIDPTHRRVGNLNYNAEFGEEPDFTKEQEDKDHIKKDLNKHKKQNHSNKKK